MENDGWIVLPVEWFGFAIYVAEFIGLLYINHA
jgi:hypothetical protein